MTEYMMIYANISKSIYSNKSLSALDKLIYERITALTHKDGYCYATNEYIANIYGVKKNTVSASINKMVKQKLLKSKMVKEGTNNTKRYLYLSNDVYDKNRRGIAYSSDTPIPYINDHNNKINNKKNNKIIDSIYYKDEDGNEYWHGELIKSNPLTEEEQQEMDDLLKEFREGKEE